MRRGQHQHLDNDGLHDYDANDNDHGDNDDNDDQQMIIVCQFSHSQVEEEDCSGVAADSGAVCGDFPFFPFFSICSYFHTSQVDEDCSETVCDTVETEECYTK